VSHEGEWWLGSILYAYGDFNNFTTRYSQDEGVELENALEESYCMELYIGWLYGIYALDGNETIVYELVK